jgi:hypothetical protein
MVSKLFWLLLAVVAAVVLVPSLRQKVWPKVQPAMNPVYEWSARSRVDELRGLIQRNDALGHTVPTGDEFDTFVDHEDTQENASIDPWGTPYYIVINRDNTFQIGSAGKDRQPGTDDDILSDPAPMSHPPQPRF